MAKVMGKNRAINTHKGLANDMILFQYSNNQITKKEPKSDDRLSKFDWHDLSPIFLAIMLPHKPKSNLETNKTSFARYSLIQQS